MADAARIKEAEECFRKADKYLKPSILSLKFKGDFDSAAAEYERAAVCYKNAKQLNKCREAHLKAAECYDQLKNLFHAAKSREQAALTSRDMGEMDKAMELMEAASQLYSESGTPETSAAALEKAAKFFEGKDDEKAIKMYQKAYYLVQETDKTKQAGEYLHRLTKLYLKAENYKEAASSMEKEVDLYKNVGELARVGRLATSLVLLHLVRGDSVQADKSLSWALSGGLAESVEAHPDVVASSSLIQAFENGEAERLHNILEQPHLKAMDNEILRLMKRLRENVPKGERNESGQHGEEEEEEDLK